MNYLMSSTSYRRTMYFSDMDNVTANVTRTRCNGCYTMKLKAAYGDTVYYIFQSLWIMLAYTVVLKTIYKHESLRGPRYISVIYLAIIDMTFSISVLLYILSQGTLIGQAFQIISETAFIYSVIISVFLTIDQYVAIKHCLRYHVIMSGKRVKLMMCSTMILCTVTYLPIKLLMVLKIEIVFKLTIVSLSAIILTVNSINSFKEAERSMQRIIKATVRLHGVTAEQYYLLVKRQKSNREIIAISASTLFFFVAAIIFLVLNMYRPVSPIVYEIGAKLVNAYPIVNPIIYVLTLKQLKTFLKRDWNQAVFKIKSSRVWKHVTTHGLNRCSLYDRRWRSNAVANSIA